MYVHRNMKRIKNERKNNNNRRAGSCRVAQRIDRNEKTLKSIRSTIKIAHVGSNGETVRCMNVHFKLN